MLGSSRGKLAGGPGPSGGPTLGEPFRQGGARWIAAIGRSSRFVAAVPAWHHADCRARPGLLGGSPRPGRRRLPTGRGPRRWSSAGLGPDGRAEVAVSLGGWRGGGELARRKEHVRAAVGAGEPARRDLRGCSRERGDHGGSPLLGSAAGPDVRREERRISGERDESSRDRERAAAAACRWVCRSSVRLLPRSVLVGVAELLLCLHRMVGFMPGCWVDGGRRTEAASGLQDGVWSLVGEHHGGTVWMGAEGRQLSGKPGGDEAPGPVALAFGEQVRSVQRDRGLTVRAFAEQLGISHGFLCDVQAGKAKPSPSLVARIDEIGELGGALVRAYPELLAEHEARKRARAERRRQLLGEAQGPTSGRSNQSPESSGKTASTQKPRYSGGTLALEPHAQATAREDDANRREAIKTLGALVAAGAARARSFLRYVESPNVGPLTLDEYDEKALWLSEKATTQPIPRLLPVAHEQFEKVAALLREGSRSTSATTRPRVRTCASLATLANSSMSTCCSPRPRAARRGSRSIRAGSTRRYRSSARGAGTRPTTRPRGSGRTKRGRSRVWGRGSLRRCVRRLIRRRRRCRIGLCWSLAWSRRSGRRRSRSTPARHVCARRCEGRGVSRARRSVVTRRWERAGMSGSTSRTLRWRVSTLRWRCCRPSGRSRERPRVWAFRRSRCLGTCRLIRSSAVRTSC